MTSDAECSAALAPERRIQCIWPEVQACHHAPAPRSRCSKACFGLKWHAAESGSVAMGELPLDFQWHPGQDAQHTRPPSPLGKASCAAFVSRRKSNHMGHSTLPYTACGLPGGARPWVQRQAPFRQYIASPFTTNCPGLLPGDRCRKIHHSELQYRAPLARHLVDCVPRV